MMSLFNSFISNNHPVTSIVFGYIREHESLKSVNIPSVISYTCLKYYFINEFFDKALSNYFEISNDKMMITNIGGLILASKHKICCHHVTPIYCHQWIPTSSNIMVQWTFFIKKMQNGMIFGLTSNATNINKDFCISGLNRPYYQLENTGVRYSHEIYPLWHDAHFRPLLRKKFRWKSGDTITFILDLNNETNQFCIQINDQPRQILFHNVTKGNIKYKMAIQTPIKGDCVILKNFQESYS